MITDEPQLRVLGSHMSFLKDAEGQWTIEQVNSSAWQERFTTSASNVPNFGITDAVYWFRFDVQNVSALSRDLVLEIRPATLDHVDVYMSYEGDWKHWQTGDSLPFSQRPIDYRYFLFPVDIKPEKSLTFYIRAQSSAQMRLFATLSSSDVFIAKQHQENWTDGVLYGFLIMMVFLNSIFFVFLREKLYLYHIIFNLACLMFPLAAFGLGFQFLWPNHPQFANISVPVFSYFALFTIALLTQKMLELPARSPRLNLILSGLAVVSALGFFLAFLIPVRVSTGL
ncbi:MAG: 7TM-DISM domain-containing protein, partial [Pseudomonadota bacterium]